MEYNFYLEQKYLYEGCVEARILTAAQAEALGYEDDYRRSTADHKLYVDGFNSVEAIHSYLERPERMHPGRVAFKRRTSIESARAC